MYPNCSFKNTTTIWFSDKIEFQSHVLFLSEFWETRGILKKSNQMFYLSLFMKIDLYGNKNIRWMSCSWHQTPNLVFPNFFHEFFSAWAVEKENKHFIGPKQVFSWCYYGLMKSLFTFSNAEKKLGNTRLVVWWFDVTNRRSEVGVLKFLVSELIKS